MGGPVRRKLGNMRRVNVWVLVPAVLLALGVGVLVGRAGDDGNETASTTSSTVRTTTSTTEDTTTTSEDTTTTTTSATTTTTAAAGAARTTTTVRASAPATQTSTETSIRPATTTPGQPSDPACGGGTAAASAHLVVTGSGTQPNATYTYSGPVTVTNNTGKAIEITSLVVRLTSKDGTIEDVAVTGAAGTVIATGASKDIPFSYSTSHPPKDTNGTSLAAFAYKPPGGTRNCAST